MDQVFRRTPLNLDSKGFYRGEYHVEFDAHEEQKFSRRAFVLPGQGVSFPGMMKDLLANHRCIKNELEQNEQWARTHLDLSFQKYILQPEELSDDDSPLNQLLRRNLSLYSLCSGLSLHLSQRGVKPEIIVGHSFGELMALGVTGLVANEDLLQLLTLREQVLHEQKAEGGLIVCSLRTDQKVEDLISILSKEGIAAELSMVNSGKQVTIGIAQKNLLENAKKLLAHQKVACKVLDEVPYPFHTSFLEEAGQILAKKVEESGVVVQKPETAFYSSAFGEIYDQENFENLSLSQLFARQLSETLDFNKSIEMIYELRRISSFLEVGPSSAHVGFVQSALQSVEDLSCNSCTNLFADYLRSSKSEVIVDENSLVFRSLQRIIAKITGYQEVEVTIGKRFQEDLGIDSIKKAEILFKVLEEQSIIPDQNFNLSMMPDLASAVSYLEQVNLNGANTQEGKGPRIGEFKRYGLAWQARPLYVLPGLEKPTLESVIISPEEFFAEGFKKHFPKIWGLGEGEVLNIIFDFRNWREATSEIEQLRRNQEVLEKLKNDILSLSEEGDLGDWQLNFVVLKDQTHPFLEGLDAFFRSIKKEKQFFFFKAITVEGDYLTDSLVNLVSQEMFETQHCDVKYVGNQRYVRDLLELNTPKLEESLKGKVVVLIGGAKGITNTLAEGLASEGAFLILVGRSSVSDKKVLAGLKKVMAAGGEVEYFSADVTDANEIHSCLHKIRSQFGAIHSIVCGAGFEVSRRLELRNKEESQREVAVKTMATINLLDAGEALGVQQLILFSSTSGWFGNDGQPFYAFVNRWMDTYIEQINGQKNLKVKSLLWPPWNNKGMTKQPAIMQRFIETGSALMSEEQGRQLFKEDLLGGSDAVVMYFDESDRCNYNLSLRDFRPFFRQIGAAFGGYPLKMIRKFYLDHDLFLNDHTIQEYKVVPGAFFVSWILNAMFVAHNKRVGLIDFTINHMMLVSQDNDYITLEVSEVGQNQWRTTGYSGIPNFSADVLGEESVESDQPLWVNEFKARSAVSTESFYEHIGFGPMFQTLDEIVEGEGQQLRSQIVLGKQSLLGDQNPYAYLTSVVDSCFQLCCVGSLIHMKAIVVPTKVKEIIVHDLNFQGQMQLNLKIDSIEDQMMVADALVINGKGELVVSLKGIEMVSITDDPNAINLKVQDVI